MSWTCLNMVYILGFKVHHVFRLSVRPVTKCYLLSSSKKASIRHWFLDKTFGVSFCMVSHKVNFPNLPGLVLNIRSFFWEVGETWKVWTNLVAYIKPFFLQYKGHNSWAERCITGETEGLTLLQLAARLMKTVRGFPVLQRFCII